MDEIGFCSCGESVTFYSFLKDHAPKNPDLFTPDGFIWLWEKCVKQKWWKEFMLEYGHRWDNDVILLSVKIVELLIAPLTFPNRVREFLEGMK